VDHNPTTAGRFNVQSIPTLILFKNGQPVETLGGAVSKKALLGAAGTGIWREPALIAQCSASNRSLPLCERQKAG